jgi:OmpA-OmpF porin, OOP family
MDRPLLLVCFFVLAISVAGNAQAKLSSNNKKAIALYTEADNYRVRRQYRQAIDLLTQAITRDKNFVEAYYRLGLVYFNMRVYPKAIEQFEKALALTQDLRIKKVVWYDLGEAYLLLGEYEKSMTVLKLFIDNEKLNRNKLDQARRNLENAKFAISNREAAGDIKQGPLSDTVNRFVLQYFPVLTADESQLFFTRRTGHSDRHDEDLVVSSKNAQGQWTEPVSISANINSEMNEGTCTISADGRKLIFTSCSGRDNYGSCDLFESNKIGDEWSVPKNLGPGVNTSGWESQPSLSADGRTLYFVSDRRTGLGMRDIWVSTLDENDRWSKAVNLGPPVNSEFDEMSPFIHVNGRTLFFATNARKGFGGYDIFYSEAESAGWSIPQNIGAYINNHDDQFSLFITADGEKGYYSHEETRQDGYSYSRIYEVRIPEDKQVRFKSNYVKGVVRDSETSVPLSARIELVELETNRIVSRVNSDSVSGEYLMVLTQGAEYALYVTRSGYLFKSLNFNYSEMKDFQPVVVNVALERVREGSNVVLNNIFFDVDKYELKEKSTVELEKIVRFLNENPNTRIQISGHTDNTGSADHNKELSRRRAAAVYNYLIKRGVSESRVRYQGYGADRPIADNATDEGRQLNRRIDFSILR